MAYDAATDYPVHELIRRRYSPRAFADRPVEKEKLHSIFEAARWAPSCFNEQPWRFLVSTREDKSAFAQMLSCLMEGNQSWAQHAPVLAIAAASMLFARNGKPNRHALHDVGLASAQLTLEATAQGLAVHQMAGFDQDRTTKIYQIPEGFEPVTALAIGYPGEVASLPEGLQKKELAPRERKAQSELLFSKGWGQPWT